ncbi:hypothetical protein [Sorangium sp. So ce887]|uniref:hypothetical protein n=1 Tax=Sorangium sp. So ce887 TaxID=3133324 RepID=UPI003F63AB4B
MGWVEEERQLASGDQFIVRRTYDLMGNVLQRTTSLGHSVAFARDACGRATQVVLDGHVAVGVAIGAPLRMGERRGAPRGHATAG